MLDLGAWLGGRYAIPSDEQPSDEAPSDEAPSDEAPAGEEEHGPVKRKART